MGSKVHQTISRALLIASTLTLLGLGTQAHALELAFSNTATGAFVSGVMAFIPTERRQSPQERNMVQENRRFHPHVLVIPKGSTVNFPNRDNTQHHVYSLAI